jgi:outer membrane protein TolC
MKKCIIYILFLLAAISLKAQDTIPNFPKPKPILTAQDAVKIALENNYDIRISRNNLRIDKTNVTLGNAGILPAATANITNNNSLQNSSQTKSDGTTTNLDNAKANSLNYGVSLGWTIFDGFGMFARYDQLKELKRLGDAQLQLAILSKVGDVANTYYNIVQQQQVLASLDSTLVISRQRVTLAQNRFTIGKASKLEVLNAKVDLNTDETSMLRQKELYANTKIQLNEILARDTKTDFVVSEEFTVDDKLLLPELETLAQKQNPSLQAQEINKRVAELQLKAVRAQRYPTVSLNGGYNFAKSESSLGFTTQTSAHGLTYGFGASLNIFNGLNQNRLEKVAKLQIENSKILIEQQNEAVLSQLGTAYQTYLTNLTLVDLEAKNEEIARENLDITMDKYRIGTITTLEYRTAQLNYLNAQVRHSEAKYNAKISEISLRELAGNLSF